MNITLPEQLYKEAVTPRQRLRELSRLKLTEKDDFIAQVRLAKARAYQLYLENKERFDGAQDE